MHTSISNVFLYILLILHFIPNYLYSQNSTSKGNIENHVITSAHTISQKNKKNNHPERIGKKSIEEWIELIDETWGEGLPTDEKLDLFDKVWNDIDTNYGAFINYDVNIDSLRAIYRPEIENGVSRGRFAAIMTHFTLALQDAHTFILDKHVSWGTPISSDIPLFMVGASGENARFGAVLTPLPDSSLLVIKALSNHVLELEPGDVVLGYDGIPWKILYKQLLDVQFPIATTWIWGSTDESMTHIMLRSAGFNAHLFDIIDIIKYESKDTLHLSTDLLNNQNGSIWGNEQLDIPGVEWPNYSENDYVSWGIVEDTNIGYVYVTSWDQNSEYQIENQFYDAIDSLMNHYQTSGLIFDFRLNTGGTFLTERAYSLLFNSYQKRFEFHVRDDASIHTSMKLTEHQWYLNAFNDEVDSNTYYSNPIAILMGPLTVSAGDWESRKLATHPMARTFGKSTNGAFTISDFPDLGYSDWYYTKAYGAGYIIEDDEYLAHNGVQPDHEVWLEKDDVAKGTDTVVKTALAWFEGLSYAYDVSVNSKFIHPGEEAIITAKVSSPNNNSLVVQAILNDEHNVVVNSINLFDDGTHNDGEAQDGVWGGIWPVGIEERSYIVAVKTEDLNSLDTHVLEYGTYFTTIGPIRVDSAWIISQSSDRTRIKLSLTNAGANSTALNIKADISADDNCVYSINQADLTFDIEAGQTQNELPYRLNTLSCLDSINLVVSIFSNGHEYWLDSLSIPNYTLPIKVVGTTQSNVPAGYSLSQNYPNPFREVTTIEYELVETTRLTLKIYDMTGRTIKTLVDEAQISGRKMIVWDGKNYEGNSVPNGIYIYKIFADNFSQSRKMLRID